MKVRLRPRKNEQEQEKMLMYLGGVGVQIPQRGLPVRNPTPSIAASSICQNEHITKCNLLLNLLHPLIGGQ